MLIHLPDDILHLICAELQQREDFHTLFNCATTSRRLAVVALVSLYRIYNQSHVTDEEPAHQNVLVQKWSILWRSLILSSMGRTFFPYHQYIRVLNLRDLQNLFSDYFFEHYISKTFFQDDLAQFQVQIPFPVRTRKGIEDRTRLDAKAVIEAVGTQLIQNMPLLEQLFPGDISSASLLRWVQLLPRLQRLELWEGDVLSDQQLRNSICTKCPSFDSLSLYKWMPPQSDRRLADFLNGLASDTLRFFETISSCGINTETCYALGNHGKSLQQLHLSIRAEAVPALALLRDCTTIQVLHLEVSDHHDENHTPKDVLADVVAWLNECKRIREIHLTGFNDGAAIITPLLLNSTVPLQELSVCWHTHLYNTEECRNLYRALAHKKELNTLCLKAPHIDISVQVYMQDMEELIEAVVQLKNLRRLELYGIHSPCREENIIRLLSALDRLEEIYTSGYGTSDAVLDSVSKLVHLRRITFGSVTSFTPQGFLCLIDKLGHGNRGIVISIDAANADKLWSEEERTTIRKALYDKVEGKIEYSPQAFDDDSDE